MSIEDTSIRYKMYSEAKSKTTDWHSILYDIYQYFLPHKCRFYNKDIKRDSVQVFDPTPILAVEEFANFIRETLLPTEQQWVTLRAGKIIENADIDEGTLEDINRRLQNDTEVLFQYIHDSDFTMAVSESLYELAAGTAAISLQEGTFEKPLVFRSVPIPSIILQEDNENNDLQNVYRDWCLRPSDIPSVFPAAKVPPSWIKKDPTIEEKRELIEGCIRDTKTGGYIYFLMDSEQKIDLVKMRVPFTPFCVFRYRKFPGEIFGRGPAGTALSAAKVLNRLKESRLQSIQYDVTPVYLDKTGNINNPYFTQIEPGMLIPIRWDLSGSPIEPLPRSGDPRITYEEIERERQIIREVMLANPMAQNMEEQDPVRTATEISIRQRAFFEKSGSAASRIAKELIIPIIEKSIQILRRKSILKDLVINGQVVEYSVNSKAIKIAYQSPLLDIQNMNSVKRLTEFAQVMTQISSIPQASLFMNVNSIPYWLSEKMSVDLDLVKSSEGVQQSLTKSMQNLMHLHQVEPGQSMIDSLKTLDQMGAQKNAST